MSARSVTTQSVSGSVRGSIKFAGEEAKDKMYEPKHNKKVVRVLTVIAYVFSVSLAAIMLSMYYIFIWQGTKPDQHHHHHSAGNQECRHAGGISGHSQDLVHIPVYNESQIAETPRVLPAQEILPPTTPLAKLARQYLELRQQPLSLAQPDDQFLEQDDNYTLPVPIYS